MKAKKNKFNPFKCHPFLAAALIVDNKYLVLRSASREKFAKQGYYFPGCQMDAKLADRKQLKNQMYTKYRLQVKVGRYLGRETAKLKGHKYCALHLYRCSLTLSNTITTVDVIPHLFSAEELVNIKLIPPDDLMAKRIAVFDKVYRETSRKVALNEHDYALAKMYYKCLLYYRDKIDYQDIIDFAKLFKADTSISEIEKAFVYISERSHISLKEYIEMNKALLKKEALGL